jgi:hypothetical protein
MFLSGYGRSPYRMVATIGGVVYSLNRRTIASNDAERL